MEINDQIMKLAIQNSLSSVPNVELKQTVDDLLTLPAGKMITGGAQEVDSLVCKVISEIKCRLRSVDPNISCLAVQDLASVISLLRHYSSEAITKSDIKYLILFLRINCYLKINILMIIDIATIDKGIMQRFKNVLASFVGKLRFDITTLDGAPYYEKTLVKKYFNGLVANEIELVYEFVNAIERGIGFHRNYTIIEQAIDVLYQFDSLAYFNLIQKLERPHEIIIFLESLTEASVLKVAEMKPNRNRWLCVELIRQLFGTLDCNKPDEKVVAAIECNLICIRSISQSFFINAITHFLKWDAFNMPLGVVLAKLSNDEISLVVQKCFVIDRYCNKIDARSKLLQAFMLNADQNKCAHFMKSIYDKWARFFHELENDSDFFCDSIVYTDYANFIAQYYIVCNSDVEILLEIEKVCSMLLTIDSIWFKTISRQESLYFLGLTKLYLLSYAFENKHIVSRRHTKLVDTIASNTLWRSKFASKKQDYDKVIVILKKNFGIMGGVA